MRILFISRATLYSAPGGDTVQIESTAKYLRKLSVDIDIKLSNQIIDYSTYDLLHFFNIIRPADIIKHVQLSQKPFVLSPIFVDYSEYDTMHRGGLAGMLGKVVSTDRLEYFKAVSRLFVNREKIVSRAYLFKGHRQSIIYLLKKSSCLLPNSQNEYERLYKKYGVHKKYVVVPNAIDTLQFNQDSASGHIGREGVVCVARIEGIKNQINLIRALNNSDIPLTLIGKAAPNHRAYANLCRREATSNVRFVDHLPQNQLAEIYQSAKVHVLPSWFETTGLASLEAAVMGCNIVVTDKGDTKEYFRNFAYYCSPNDPQSIRKAVMDAYQAPVNPKLKQLILENYTWDKTAEQTLEAYHAVMKK